MPRRDRLIIEKRHGTAAGEIEIGGEFVKSHFFEIANRIRHIEDLEKRKHPMERILSFENKEENISIKTSGIHLAGRIGKGLQNSFKGDL